MSNLVLLEAQFRRELILLKRYFFNFLGGFLTFCVVFILLFLGYRGLAGGTEIYGTGLENLIVGYITWILAMHIYQDISSTLFQEAREGVLEQLYMSPYGYSRVTITRLLASLGVHLVMVFSILQVLILITKRSFNLDLVSIFPLLILLLLPVVGIGFFLGGLQLHFKRIRSILQIVQFLLIVIVVAPINLFWASFLPGTMASHLIREVMIGGAFITELPLEQVLLALFIAFIFPALGWGIFKLCEKKALESGRLGQF